MFLALLVYPQEVLHRQITLYARNIPSAVRLAPPEDEQVTLETCRSPYSSETSVRSRIANKITTFHLFLMLFELKR
jgi:hypothetical protein